MIKHTAIAMLLFALMPAISGCAEGTTKQGTLYSMNASRALEAYLAAELDAVHKAAVKSVNDAGYTVDEDAIDVREGVVKGRTARDRTVRVETYKEGDKVTKIEVYVGGDEAAASELLDSIESQVD
jgi:hypothetical protein